MISSIIKTPLEATVCFLCFVHIKRNEIHLLMEWECIGRVTFGIILLIGKDN